MSVSKNSGFSPQIIHFDSDFHYKPSILGYHYFRKHPNGQNHKRHGNNLLDVWEIPALESHFFLKVRLCGILLGRFIFFWNTQSFLGIVFSDIPRSHPMEKSEHP